MVTGLKLPVKLQETYLNENNKTAQSGSLGKTLFKTAADEEERTYF